MRWIRAYVKDIPTTLETGRAIVYDPGHCEFFYQMGYNYIELFEQADDDIILVEWDMALSKEDRSTFEQYCLADKEKVHVAPYRHYFFKSPAKEFSWIHRRDLDTLVVENEPDCMLFGFGLVYLPYKLMKQYLYDITRPEQFVSWMPYQLLAFPDKTQEMPMPLPKDIVRDTYFSMWHWSTQKVRVPIHWDVRPIHLHYDASPRVFTGRKQPFVPYVNPVPVARPAPGDENPRFA